MICDAGSGNIYPAGAEGGFAMPDSFVETSSTSWLSRIVGSITGALFDIIFIIGSIILLFWNEGRAVQTARSLSEGGKVVVGAASAPSGFVIALAWFLVPAPGRDCGAGRRPDIRLFRAPAGGEPNCHTDGGDPGMNLGWFIGARDGLAGRSA